MPSLKHGPRQRITQGKLELRRARVDLGTIIQIAIEANRPLLESKQQHVTVEWPPQPVYVEADMTRLTQVFSNLLNNSAKYSDSQASIRAGMSLDGATDQTTRQIELDRLRKIRVEG